MDWLLYDNGLDHESVKRILFYSNFIPHISSADFLFGDQVLFWIPYFASLENEICA